MWCDDIQRVNANEYSIWWTIGDGFELLNSCPKSNGRSQFQAQNSCQMRFGQDEESRAVNRMFVENLENERRKDSLKLSFSRGHNWFFGGPRFFSVGDLSATNIRWNRVNPSLKFTRVFKCPQSSSWPFGGRNKWQFGSATNLHSYKRKLGVR